MNAVVLLNCLLAVCQVPNPPAKPAPFPATIVEGHVITVGKVDVFPGAPVGPKGAMQTLNLELIVEPQKAESPQLFQLGSRFKVVDGSGKTIESNGFRSVAAARTGNANRKSHRIMVQVANTPEKNLRSVSGVLLLADAINQDFVFNANQFTPNTVVELGSKRCKLTMFDRDEAELFVEFKSTVERLSGFGIPGRINRDEIGFIGGIAPASLRVLYSNGKTATPISTGSQAHSNGKRVSASTRFQIATAEGEPTRMTFRLPEILGPTKRIPFVLENIRIPEPRPIVPPKKHILGPIASSRTPAKHSFSAAQ